MNDLFAPTEALADWLRLSPRRVSQLGHEAGAKRTSDGWPVGPLVKLHVGRLREKAELAGARRRVLELQGERARVAAARAARELIPEEAATAAARRLWGDVLDVMNGGFSELAHHYHAQGAPAGEVRATLEPIRKFLLGRLVVLRDRLPGLFAELVLDTDEKLDDWLASHEPEAEEEPEPEPPPKPRRAKATRRAPSR